MSTPSSVPLSKISDVTRAFKAFPQPVFKAWIEHRRGAADALCPEWRHAPGKIQRVLLLDRAASVWAQFN